MIAKAQIKKPVVMTPRRRNALITIVLLFVYMFPAVTAVTAQPRPTAPTPSPPLMPIDPALSDNRRVRELINQMREDLYVNRDPKAVIEKCRQIFRIDPNNQTAKFFMTMAERQLRGEATTGPRVSALPDPAHLPDIVSRSQATTGSMVGRIDPRVTPAVTPSVSGSHATVVDSRRGIEVPKPQPWWLNPRFLMWVAGAVFGLLAVSIFVIVLERTSSGKREKRSRQKVAEQMRGTRVQPRETAAAPAPQNAPVLPDDFLLGAPHTATPAGATAAAAAPTFADDAEVDIWQGETPAAKEKPAADTNEATKPRPAPREEPTAVSAREAFADNAPDDQPLPAPTYSSDKDWQPQTAPRTAAPSGTRSAPQKEEAFVKSPPPRPVAGEDDGPIELDGISFDSVQMEPGEESSSGAQWKRSLRPDEGLGKEMSIQPPPSPAHDNEILDTLDLGPAQAEESALPAGPGAPSPSPPAAFAPIEPNTGLLDDDLPSLEEEPLLSPQPFSSAKPTGQESVEPTSPLPPPSPLEANAAKRQDENVAIPLGHSAEDDLVDFDADHPAAETTIVNDQSRHRAVFHDQLARGLDAMEKGRWKEAVKLLSVAHAMDPADEYVREKLHQARKKRDEKTG